MVAVRGCFSLWKHNLPRCSSYTVHSSVKIMSSNRSLQLICISYHSFIFLTANQLLSCHIFLNNCHCCQHYVAQLACSWCSGEVFNAVKTIKLRAQIMKTSYADINTSISSSFNLPLSSQNIYSFSSLN